MTPKERAKLVISLELKGLNELPIGEAQKYDEGEIDTRPTLSTQADIRMIIASCPSSDASEYNYLVSLHKAVWKEIIGKMCDYLTRIELMAGDIRALSYLISIDFLIQHMIDELSRVPVIVSKKDYDEGVLSAREFERAQVIQLHDRYNLAEEEAYARLIKEGKILEGGDLDEYLDFIENYGKTEEDLFNEKLQEIKKGIEEYKERKTRLEGDEPLFSWVSKYVDLTEDKLHEEIKKSYKDYFMIPTQEEFDLWQKTIEEERLRLLEAVKVGQLKAKDNGIEAGSYYDWTERHQKFAGEEGSSHIHWNPLNEDCLEIGYADGKVASSGQALKSDNWRHIVIATPHNENMPFLAGPDKDGQTKVDSVLDLLRMLAPFQAINKDTDANKITLKFSKDTYEEMIVNFVEQATILIRKIVNYKALIEEIERKYFDGMDIVNKDPLAQDISIGRIEEAVQNVINTHNNRIKDALKQLNRTDFGFCEFELEDMDEYLLKAEHGVDNNWVAKQLARLEAEARES